MADSYTQATVEPFIPDSVCGIDRLELLETAGFQSEEVFGEPTRRYFFAENGINEYDIDDNEIDYVSVFQQMLKEAGLEELFIVGAFICSKMRPGEFGGFVTRITPDTVQHGNTYTLQELMQKGEL